MKSKKVKKLVLMQETISTLNEDEMNKIKGGYGGTLFGYVFNSCAPTPNSCQCSNDCGPQTNQTECGTCYGDGSGYGVCCYNATNLCQ
jgi:bacteriocin-like protein